MIEIHQLHKRFGHVAAVNGLSFSASDGAITGLLGANGAGKTTTLGMICGLLAPDSGRVWIGSKASNGCDRRSLIGTLLDHQGLYPRLTARENIAYFGELHGLSGPALRRRVTELMSVLGLDELADRLWLIACRLIRRLQRERRVGARRQRRSRTPLVAALRLLSAIGRHRRHSSLMSFGAHDLPPRESRRAASREERSDHAEPARRAAFLARARTTSLSRGARRSKASARGT